MRGKWTPGPWRLMPSSPSNYETIVSDTETFLFDGRECAQHVAITTKNYGEDTGSIREGRELANAYLIAAAPALYEALEKAVSLYQSYGLLAQSSDCGEWVNSARAALSQALPPKGDEL